MVFSTKTDRGGSTALGGERGSKREGKFEEGEFR